MNDEADVRLVDPHPKGVGGDDGLELSGHEAVLRLAPPGGRDAPVIVRGLQSLCFEYLRDRFAVLDRGAVDDAGAVDLAEEPNELLLFRDLVDGRPDLVVQVRPED